MTNCRTATQERRRRAVRRPMLISLGLALGLALMAASEARAEYYRVYTSSAFPATLLNEADGVCTLAEAVASINQGSPAYNCFDYDPSAPTPTIELRQAANKPYSTHHFVIPSGFTNNPNIANAGFEIKRRVYIGTYEAGGTAYIDAGTMQAFLINSGVEVTLYGLEITHTGTGAGRAVTNRGSLWASTCTFTNGNVSGITPGQGGAIYNSSYLNLSWSNVRNSSAKKGGGIYNLDGSLNLFFTTISGNSATRAGGGIYNMSTANQGGVPKGLVGGLLRP
jgi:Chlamydia polymorphic membrane protein (Chlamydia_PMP) repeat